MSDPVIRRYTFKLYPRPAQEEALRRTAAMCAQLWNALLQRREDVYRRERRTLTAFDLGREITHLRAEMPEWAAMPRSIQERVCGNLDDAFKAFFRRVKAGEKRAGYPRYKPTRDAVSIPLREMTKGGWSFRPTASGPEADAGRTQSWRLYLKTCGGTIRARGRFPAVPSAIKTADIAFYGGSWWLSVAVSIRRERAAGEAETRIRFDLVDEFARVERAEGECVSPGRFSDAETTKKLNVSTDSIASGAEAVETGAEHRSAFQRPAGAAGAEAVETGAEHRLRPHRSISTGGAEAVETGAEHRCGFGSRRRIRGAEAVDALKSARDARFKRGSIRWRREKAHIARLSAREARQRRESLHLWSSLIVRRASALHVTAPAIKEETETGRGNAQHWGAAVEIKARLNRHILSMAPASAIQMLTYKSAEAGIEFVITNDEAPVTAVGRDLVLTTKLARKAKRALSKGL